MSAARAARPARARKTCTTCGKQGHTKRTCDLRGLDGELLPEREHGRFCAYCFDLAHVRPRRGGCPGCKRRYQADQIIAIAPTAGCGLGLF